MDKLRGRYIVLKGCSAIIRNIALVNMVISLITYLIHLCIDNDISTTVFLISSIVLVSLIIIYKIICILADLTAIKIDKEIEYKRD